MNSVRLKLAVLGIVAVLFTSDAMAQSLVWVRQFQGRSWGVAVDEEGNVFVASNVRNATDSRREVVLRKFDAFGKVIYTSLIADPARDYFAYGVAVDGSGNAVLAGLREGGMDADVFVAKIKGADGSELWRHFVGAAGVNDEARGIAADSNDNVYVGGQTDGVLDPSDPTLASAGLQDAFLRKYDPQGNVEWTVQFGTPQRDQIRGVATDVVGNVLVAGRTSGNLAGPLVGTSDAFLRKYDSAGVVQWTDQYGMQSELIEGKAVAVDQENNPFLAGDIDFTAFQYIRKYNSAGIAQWTRKVSPQPFERNVAVAADGDGDSYLAGMTFDAMLGPDLAGGDGGDDAYVRKYSPNGNIDWTIRLGGTAPGALPSFDKSYAITAFGNGNVYLSGETNGTFPDAGVGGGFLARLASDVDADDVKDAVEGIPEGAFAGGGFPEGQRNAIESILRDIDRAIADGRIAEAIRKLQNLRGRVDGCEDGPPADSNDWITDCDVQDTLRALIDSLIDDLMS